MLREIYLYLHDGLPEKHAALIPEFLIRFHASQTGGDGQVSDAFFPVRFDAFPMEVHHPQKVGGSFILIGCRSFQPGNGIFFLAMVEIKESQREKGLCISHGAGVFQ